MLAARARVRRRVAGFSFIELMIAMMIIAISLFGILSMITYVMRVRDTDRETAAAREWVERQIENKKSQPFTALVAGTTTFPSTAFNSTPLAALSPTGTLSIDLSNPGLAEIVCSISWKGRNRTRVDGNGNTGNYSMRSLYSK